MHRAAGIALLPVGEEVKRLPSHVDSRIGGTRWRLGAMGVAGRFGFDGYHPFKTDGSADR